MSQLPLIAQAFSAFLTPVIAVGVAYIAWQQHLTARAKLNLDLFEKRLGVYHQVRAAVSKINTSGKADDESDRLLLEAINASEFLFGEDIRTYLDAMWLRFNRLRVAGSTLKHGDEEARRKAAAAQGELFSEITQFYYEGADVFAHYMRMDHTLRSPLKTRRQRPTMPTR